LFLREDQNDSAEFCFGVIHGGAADQPNFLRFVANHFPKTEVRKKQEEQEQEASSNFGNEKG